MKISAKNIGVKPYLSYFACSGIWGWVAAPYPCKKKNILYPV